DLIEATGNLMGSEGFASRQRLQNRRRGSIKAEGVVGSVGTFRPGRRRVRCAQRRSGARNASQPNTWNRRSGLGKRVACNMWSAADEVRSRRKRGQRHTEAHGRPAKGGEFRTGRTGKASRPAQLWCPLRREVAL